jgi:hypothetical protein
MAARNVQQIPHGNLGRGTTRGSIVITEGRAEDSRGVAEVGDLGESVDGRQVHAGGIRARRHKRGGPSSRTTRTRSWPPICSSCRPSPSRSCSCSSSWGHDRRRLVHVAVTEHPTAAWTAPQLRNAFPDQAPGYLLHERDAVFADVATTIAAMNIRAVPTAPCSPWQNAYVERVIGSIRRECLDLVVVLSAAGLHRVLTDYTAYYMGARAHLALAEDSPTTRPIMPPSAGHVVPTPASRRAPPSLRPRSGVTGVRSPALLCLRAIALYARGLFQVNRSLAETVLGSVAVGSAIPRR